MKLGYVIFYVGDVVATVEFYERAFGLRRRHVHENDFAEMETGETALAFAKEALVESNGVAFLPSRAGDARPPAAEIALVVDDPQGAFDRAVAAGATPVQAASRKPWGQIVAYIRDLNGFLVELCTPVGGA